MIEIPRFQVVDIDMKGTTSVGIKDHQDDSIVVLVSMFNEKESNTSLAEDIIICIENKLEQ